MNLIPQESVVSFGQLARSSVPQDAAAIAVLAAFALAALVAAILILRKAPVFNPVELCGPKDRGGLKAASLGQARN